MNSTKTERLSGAKMVQESITPLEDVSLVIVHVNNHYGSFDCCREQLNQLLDSRVARYVHEHSAFYESFLEKEVLNLGWAWQKRDKSDHAEFSKNGVTYSSVNHEIDPKNYKIDNLSGKRVIIVGGAVSQCHKSSVERTAEYLYSRLVPGEIGEIHIPVSLTYTMMLDDNDKAVLSNNSSSLLDYESVFGCNGKTKDRIISLDSKLVSSCFSPKEPIVHLAIWTELEDMINYLRNNGRISFKAKK